MADQGRWWKLWVTALSDPDVANLSIADFGRWAKLGAYTKAHGEGGALTIQAPGRYVCTLLEVSDLDALIACLTRFPHVRIRRDADGDGSVTVGVTVTWENWRKYQEDSSAERMRQKRARERRGVTVKKRRDEKRRDVDSNPPTPLAHASRSNTAKATAKFDTDVTAETARERDQLAALAAGLSKTSLGPPSRR